MPVASLRAPEAADPCGLPTVGNEASEVRTSSSLVFDVIADPAVGAPALM
jgi:hypothetical protein